MRQLGQTAAQIGRQQLGVARQRFGDEHRFTLHTSQRHELDFERKPPQRRLVNAVQQIGGADKNAVVALHALQHFIDFRHLIGALRTAPVLQKAVGFVK